MKATAYAHPNIALTKYWGNKIPELNVPYNNSISMNLSECVTTTTVEFSRHQRSDIIYVDGKLIKSNYQEKKNPHTFISKIRQIADIRDSAKVVSRSNFPQGSGIASSASGAAALTLAATKAAGLDLKEKEVSKLARLFSGSGCRSVPAGFVEWHAGDSHENSYAKSIAPPKHWDVIDIVAIVSSEHKKYGSSIGHDIAETSRMFETRIEVVKEYNAKIRKAILEKDFDTVGKFAEKDCASLHAVMLTSDLSQKIDTTDISMLYWDPETIQVINLVRDLRSKGTKVYFTIDAGPNVHILTQPKYQKKIKDGLDVLKSVGIVKNLIINKPGDGVKCIEEHLF